MLTNTQQMATDATTLPESRKQPHKKAIAVLIFFALALSVIFPYGLGIAVLAWGIALTGALLGVGYASYLLLKESISKTGSFSYAPTAAYLAGKNLKKKRNTTPSDEAKNKQ